jgi:hypothetical protein
VIATMRRQLCLAVAALVVLAAPAAAQLGFEDVTVNAAGVNNTRLNTPYQGYTFENFGVASTAAIGTGANAASGTRFALGQVDNGYIYRADNLRFDFLGAFLSFRAFDATVTPVAIAVNAYRGLGTPDPVFSRILTLTNTAQLFTLDFTNVDEIEFDTKALGANRSSALALDNAQLAVVPEPATVALLATGVLLLGGLHTRRRRV